MTNKLLGYEIENLNTKNPLNAAYKLHSKRTTYILFRTQNNPEIMFATNRNGNVCSVKGNYNFTDEAGKLDTFSYL